jgi:hypothetical protein
VAVLLLVNEAGVTVLDVPSLYVTVTVYVALLPSLTEVLPTIARDCGIFNGATYLMRRAKEPLTVTPFSM